MNAGQSGLSIKAESRPLGVGGIAPKMSGDDQRSKFI
jgi:hypothetical protein